MIEIKNPTGIIEKVVNSTQIFEILDREMEIPQRGKKRIYSGLNLISFDNKLNLHQFLYY